MNYHKTSCLVLLLMGATAAGTDSTNAQSTAHHDQPRSANANSDTLQLSLDSIGDAIRRHNPELATAKLRIAEAQARLKQSGLRKNPSLQTSFNHDPRFRELGGNIGFSQAFPVTSRLALEKDVSAALILVAEAEAKDVERRIIGEARLTTVRLLALLQHEGLHERQLKLAQEFANYIDDAAKRGEGSPLDAAQAKLEANQLEIEIRQLHTEVGRLTASLKRLIGLPTEASFSITGDLSKATPPVPIRVDLSRRHDYQAARFITAAAEKEIDLERARRWDDITAGLFARFFREQDAPIGLEREQRVGFQISIPLPLWNKNEGAILERKLRKTRLEQTAEAIARRIKNDVAAAYEMMSAHAALAHEIETILLPAANEQTKNTSAAYREGLVDLQLTLRAREQHLALEVARLDALRDFHLARVRHETALGNP